MNSEVPHKKNKLSVEKNPSGVDPSVDELELEKKWLQRAMVDLDNFAFFYDRYYKVIYKYVFLRTANKDTTSDIVNETFSRALSGLSKFRWQGYTVGAWLFQIARSVMYKERNDTVRRAEVPYESTSHDPIDRRTPDKEVEQLEDAEILRVCVRQLEPVRQDVFVMHYWLELTTSAIAAALALPEGTVKSHLQRGRRDLLACLKQQGVDANLSPNGLKVVKDADAREEGWRLLADNGDATREDQGEGKQ